MRPARHLRVLAAAGTFAALLSGCGAPHGQPRPGSETVAPNAVLDFNTLYSSNGAGCHGQEGRGGAAIAVGDPVYLALVDDAAVRKVIVKGVPGTAMPAFAQSAGGGREFSMAQIHPRTPRNPPAMRHAENGCTRRSARLAMGREAAADRRA